MSGGAQRVALACRQSNGVTRSYPEPVKVCAGATSKVMGVGDAGVGGAFAGLLDGFRACRSR